MFLQCHSDNYKFPFPVYQAPGWKLHFFCVLRRKRLTIKTSEAIMPHQTIWSWYTGRWCVGCYIWYREEVTRLGPSPPRPLLAVPDVTAHPSTASVPITLLLYNGPLLFLMTIYRAKTDTTHCVGNKTRTETSGSWTSNLARAPLQGAATLAN